MLFLLLLFIKSCACISMPVILMDPQTILSPDISNNPFTEMSSESFASFALDAIHKTDGVLIFIEEDFSIEDISSKDRLGNPYNYIHKNFLEDKAKFIPKVMEPFKTLEKVLPPKKETVQNAATLQFGSSKYYYIHFEKVEGKENRVNMLRRHDEFIRNAFMNFRAMRKGPILIFYTGKDNPMTGINKTYKRQSAAKRDSPDTIMLVTDQALIRLSEVVHHEGPAHTPLVSPRASTRRFARRRASTRLFYDGDFELDFNFEYLRDGWLLDSVVLLEDGEEVGRTTMGVGAPYDWSYFCSEPLIIGNMRDKSYVTISKYQVEPLLFQRNLKLQDDDPQTTEDTTEAETEASAGSDAPAGPDAEAPGGSDAEPQGAPQAEALEPPTVAPPPAADAPAAPAAPAGGAKKGFTNTQSCGTNFNCHILAGLFVAFLVISIASTGISVLFDCKSNDRMDDPNQKPLVIVAQL